MEQFKGTGVDKLTLGEVVSCVTIIEVEAEHPPGSVAVTLYVPIALTDFVAPDPPPLQA